jgi:protein phosphatase 1L
MSKLKNFFASPNGLIALYTVALVALWLLIRFIAGSFNKIVEFFKNGKLKVDPFMNGVRYPVSYWTEKGGRPYQEDRFHVMKGGSEASLYGVFDGHGGFRAAQFCKEFLLQTIGTDPDLNTSPPMAIHRSFLKLASTDVSVPRSNSSSLSRVDEEFSSKARHRMLTDGTTAVIAAIHNGRIYVGNAGDSRAILIRKDGRVQMMSQDHRPDRKDEENRIRRLGGKLLYYGSWRVEGVLAVSR